MLSLIAQIILVISVGGVLLIIARKIPALVALPAVSSKKSLKIRERFLPMVKTSVSLAKQKVSALKAIKTQDFKEEKNQKKNQVDSDSDYWEKIRKE